MTFLYPINLLQLLPRILSLVTKAKKEPWQEGKALSPAWERCKHGRMHCHLHWLTGLQMYCNIILQFNHLFNLIAYITKLQCQLFWRNDEAIPNSKVQTGRRKNVFVLKYEFLEKWLLHETIIKLFEVCEELSRALMNEWVPYTPPTVCTVFSLSCMAGQLELCMLSFGKSVLFGFCFGFLFFFKRSRSVWMVTAAERDSGPLIRF